MRGYYTYEELWKEIDAVMTRYPSVIISKFSIGRTHSGLEIPALQIAEASDIPLEERP
jgi:hypothetical protein